MGRLFFTGEHTSERFNGYVHGGYLAGKWIKVISNDLTRSWKISIEEFQYSLLIVFVWTTWAGIDTGEALLEELRKEERKHDSQTFLLEPLLALTGSLTLTQSDAVSGLHKWEIPRQLFLSTNKLRLPGAILWLKESLDKPHFDYETDQFSEKDSPKGLQSNLIWAVDVNKKEIPTENLGGSHLFWGIRLQKSADFMEAPGIMVFEVNWFGYSGRLFTGLKI